MMKTRKIFLYAVLSIVAGMGTLVQGRGEVKENRMEWPVNTVGAAAEARDDAALDSLITSIDAALKVGNLEKAEALMKEVGPLEPLIREAASESSRTPERTERIGTLLYGKAYICNVRNEIDSALYYYTARAELDTVNALWQNQTGVYLIETVERPVQAMTYFQRAARHAVAQYGDSAAITWQTYKNIAMAYEYQGKYDEALSYLKQVLEKEIARKGERNGEVGDTYNFISRVYFMQNDFAQAQVYSVKAREIWLAAYGERHPNVVTSYDNEAMICSELGDYPKAVASAEKALAIAKSLWGENDIRLIALYDRVGTMCFRTEDYARALESLNAALEMRKAVCDAGQTEFRRNVFDIYITYCAAVKKDAAFEPAFRAFMENIIPVIEVEKDGAAATQGMKGTYYLLELSGWNLDALTNFIEHLGALAGKPKTLVVMKDGVIEKHHFENTVGVSSELQYVDKAERQRVAAAYRQWKQSAENQ